MKPTKMRNRQIYQATFHTKSKQLGSQLSKELQKKYGKKSIRVVEGDTIKIVRGEFKGIDGKITIISTKKNAVAVEGVKKEKTKGEKFDVYIHTSNLLVTALNTEDKWRITKLEGKKQIQKPKVVIEKPVAVVKKAVKVNEKPKIVTEKVAKKQNMTKQTKVTKNSKKEVKK